MVEHWTEVRRTYKRQWRSCEEDPMVREQREVEKDGDSGLAAPATLQSLSPHLCPQITVTPKTMSVLKQWFRKELTA